MLYVADVYGSTPAGGSAAVLSAALAWMAQNRVPVVNVSLVGPPNITVQAVVRALVARGHLIVAAVGNDGPAAPPLYPAAYPGVIAVTAVDSRRRLLPEAGRPPKIDFTAPGADMAAPAVGGSFVTVRGTSFAAPLVAASLARHLAAPDPNATARAVQALARDAIDLGPRGSDRTYGRGLVGFDLATRPATVAARGVLGGQ
jgi:subtilisin family serine protease